MVKPTVKICKKCEYGELMLTNTLYFCNLVEWDETFKPYIGVNFIDHSDFNIPDKCPFILEHTVMQKTKLKQ